MDTNAGELEGGGEELPGRKKSRFKMLKSRLFGRLRRKEADDGLIKQSQSISDVTSDVTAQAGDDSEDDLNPPGTLGSRALSHDSIFLADQSQSSSEPTRVLSQENVHRRIRDLQLKLQQQNMRLGPPPFLIPGKRMEDSGATSEDDGLPQSPPEVSFNDRAGPGSSYQFPDIHRHRSSLSLAGTGSEEEEQASSHPLSPVVLSSATPLDSGPTPGVDLATPADYTPSLDTSAARHRLSVKPRNQRAGAKGRKLPLRAGRPRSVSMNDLDQPLSEQEEDGQQERALERGEVHKKEEEREESSETPPDHLFSSQAFKNDNPAPVTQTPSPSPRDPEEKPMHLAPPAGEKEVSQAQVSSEPESRFTTNPLFLQAKPLEEDLLCVPEPRTKTPTPEADTPTPPPATVEEVKRPSVLIKPLSTHSPSCEEERDIQAFPNLGTKPPSLKNPSLLSPMPGPGSVSNKTELPSKEYPGEMSTPATSNHKTDSLSKNTQALSLVDSSPTLHPSLSTPAPLVIRHTQRTASVRGTTVGPTSGLQGATAPPAGQDETLSGEGSGEREDSGSSHRFSISSARHRPKNSGSVHTGKTEEVKGGAAEEGGRGGGGRGGGLVAKNPTHQGPIGRQAIMTEEARLRRLNGDQSQTLFQDRRDATRLEDLSLHSLKGGNEEGNIERTEREGVEGTVKKQGEERDEQSENKEEEQWEDRRRAFGVKLRSTSQSLKYRSEKAQSEDGNKRHSVEVIATTTEEPLPIRGEDDSTSKVRGDSNKSLSKAPSQRSDCTPSSTANPSSTPITAELRLKDKPWPKKQSDDDIDLAIDSILDPDKGPSSRPAPGAVRGAECPGSAVPAGSAPDWMSLARKKTRSLQEHFTNSQQNPESTPDTEAGTRTGGVTTPQQTPPWSAPAPQLGPPPKAPPSTQAAVVTTAKVTTQQVAQLSSEPLLPTRPGLRGVSERPSTSLKRSDKTQAEKQADRVLWAWSKAESGKGQAEIHITKAEISSSSSPSSSSSSTLPSSHQSVMQRGQPSWMDLAKRKSMAWSDKTTD